MRRLMRWQWAWATQGAEVASATLQRAATGVRVAAAQRVVGPRGRMHCAHAQPRCPAMLP